MTKGWGTPSEPESELSLFPAPFGLKNANSTAFRLCLFDLLNRDATPVRCCPKCHQIVHAAVSVCNECGYEFPKREVSHESAASDANVVSGETTDTTYSVLDIEYAVHTKKGAAPGDPRTVRIDYMIQRSRPYNVFKSEWICPEHGGWARKKFEKWWSERSNAPSPETSDEVVEIARSGGLLPSIEIVVRKVGGEKYDRIIKHQLAAGPQLPPGCAVGHDANAVRTCGMCSHFANGFCLEKQQDNILETATACESFTEIDLDDVPF